MDPWNSSAGAWDAGGWWKQVSYAGEIILKPKGTWAVNYRPKKWRMTVNCSEAMTIEVDFGDQMTGYFANKSVACSAGSNIITSDVINWAGRYNFAIFDVMDTTYSKVFTITNIEFLETGPSVSPSSSTSPSASVSPSHSISPSLPSSWDIYFDDTVMEGKYGYSTWDSPNNRWLSTEAAPGAILIGYKTGTTWALGYRPITCKATVDVTPGDASPVTLNVTIYDEDYNTWEGIVENANGIVEVEILNMAFSADLLYVYVTTNWSANVVKLTNLQWLE